MRRLLTILIFLLCACSRERATRAPVIVISIDTLRADHLPAYGHRALATPAIDALRRDGILYTNAWSHCPMTLPSHASLLTGELPYVNGVRNNIGYTLDGAAHDSIPAMLKRAGYETGAAVSAYVLRGATGIGPLFDFYDDRVGGATNVGMGEVARDGFETEDVAAQWIAGRASQPFFFMLHLFEPHFPYDGSYDAEIVKSDAIVGRFLERLKAQGVYDRALIILLSDHGEGLGDHGEGEHGVFLYRETLHVPLIVKLPKGERAGTTIDTPAQLIDVAPTIAAVTGATPSKPFAGASLLALPKSRARIYSETLLPRIHFGWSELRSLTDATHQFIDAPRPELYDLARDARELTNVASEERRVFASMREEMTRHAAAIAPPSNVDPEEARKLAALGYIGQVRDASGPLPDPKDRIQDLEQLKHGSALERQGAVREAAAAYEAIVARNPAFADAWLRLGSLQDRMGRDEDAVRSYRAAIAAAPVLASQTALPLGAVYLRMRRYDDAAAHAALAMRAQPAAAHHLSGRIALARRDYAGAEREARAAMGDAAYRGPGAVLLSRVYLDQGRLSEALAALPQGAVRDAQLTRGEIFAMMDRGPEAEAALRGEIAAFPQNADAYAKLAILYRALGRQEEEERTLRELESIPGGERMAREVRKLFKGSAFGS